MTYLREKFNYKSHTIPSLKISRERHLNKNANINIGSIFTWPTRKLHSLNTYFIFLPLFILFWVVGKFPNTTSFAYFLFPQDTEYQSKYAFQDVAELNARFFRKATPCRPMPLDLFYSTDYREDLPLGFPWIPLRTRLLQAQWKLSNFQTLARRRLRLDVAGAH